MAENTSQPGTELVSAPSEDALTAAQEMGLASTPAPLIIWTPRFIVIFSLILVLGLSAEGLLTQGWRSHLYASDWVLLGHALIVLGCWLLTAACAHSGWIRAGSFFACIWALFVSFGLVFDLHAVAPSSALITHLNAATPCALLGAYTCLSLDRTPFKRWDTWVFRLAPLVDIAAVAVAYLLTPAGVRSFSSLEGHIAIAALFLCMLIWWIRPSCWLARPGPTFLFGLVPAILLLLALPDAAALETHFFLSQIVSLCMILGALRILQGENTTTHSPHNSQKNCEPLN